MVFYENSCILFYLLHIDSEIAERCRVFFLAKDVVVLLICFHHAVVVAELHLWIINDVHHVLVDLCGL